MLVLWIISTAILCGSFYVAGILLGGFFLPVGIVLGTFFLLVAITDCIRQSKRGKCKKCKRKYSLDSDISYHTISRKVKQFPLHPNRLNDHYIRSVETQKIRFDCTCPDCGSTSDFKMTLRAREIYWDGDIKDIDMEGEIYNYFERGCFYRKVSDHALFILVGAVVIALGLLFSGAVKLPFSDPGSKPAISSENDPRDYYGQYYAVTDAGLEYELHLQDDGNYVLKQTDARTNQSKSDSGAIIFKNAEDVQKLMPNTEHKGCDALFLQQNEDYYIVLWIKESTPSYSFLLDKVNVTLTKEKVSFADLNKDPQDYYGTYIGVDVEMLAEYTLKISENGYSLQTSNIIVSEKKESTYKFINAEYLYGVNNPKYTDKDALLCNDPSKNSTIVIWIHRDGENISLEFDMIDVMMTKDGESLAEYMAAEVGISSRNSNTYTYSSTNFVSFDNDGTADFCLNGEMATYQYFVATEEYMKTQIKNNNARGDYYILYTDNGNFHAFSIDGDALQYGNARFTR